MYRSLRAPSSAVNWAGFYVRDSSTTTKRLILGPFMGKVACQTIAFGKGVCGVAAQTKQAQLVRNVEAFPGHIACDGASKSEIVVPILRDNKVCERSGHDRTDYGSVLSSAESNFSQVVAIIDVDCAELDGFNAVDEDYLEQLADILSASCDWPC